MLNHCNGTFPDYYLHIWDVHHHTQSCAIIFPIPMIQDCIALVIGLPHVLFRSVLLMLEGEGLNSLEMAQEAWALFSKQNVSER